MFSLFYSGTGEGVDVVVSSVKAYLVALNKMLDFKAWFISVERIQETICDFFIKFKHEIINSFRKLQL